MYGKTNPKRRKAFLHIVSEKNIIDKQTENVSYRVVLVGFVIFKQL